jgi:DNA-binding transcriptional regulator GbsR (MarR family)
LSNKKKIEKQEQFIRSEKVIRHVLDPKTADVLAVLIYKQDYWAKKGELSKWKGKECFFISLDDIEAETCYSNSIVAKCIKKLVAEGLVFKKRQGLNKPNLYSVDKTALKAFKKSKITSFNKWQKAVRERSSSKKIDTERNIKNEESGILNLAEQEASKLSTTKNKNTENKKTKNKNLTNQASLVCEIHLGPMLELEKEIELEKVISDLRSDDDSDINERVKSLFKFLCSLVPSFKGFSMSSDDRELLLTILQSEIQDYKIASKIISNTSDIINGKKDSRFGSLFVGVVEMIANFENLCA